MAVGLVLEGGGMRGIYTAGVLEYFMEKEITFPYVIAVSAGACNAITFLSGQKRKNFRTFMRYSKGSKYLSIRNLIRKGSAFDFDFILEDFGASLDETVMEQFFSSETRFLTGVTDIETAQPLYFEKEGYREGFSCLQASCSQPFLSQIVTYHGKKLLDGGIADPIPIRKSIADGNEYNVIVLTRQRGYEKKKQHYKQLCKRLYGAYPQLVELLMKRHIQYNETLQYCYELEKQGKAVLIQPEKKLPMHRLEKKRSHLIAGYRIGIHDAKKKRKQIQQMQEKDAIRTDCRKNV